MKTPNSDGEIRPCLSNFKFYIGQTGQEEDHPLLDFNRLKDGSELGIEFTVSGLNRVYKMMKVMLYLWLYYITRELDKRF